MKTKKFQRCYIFQLQIISKWIYMHLTKPLIIIDTSKRFTTSNLCIQIISYNNLITIVFNKVKVIGFQLSSSLILQRNFLSRLIKTFIALVIFLYYNWIFFFYSSWIIWDHHREYWFQPSVVSLIISSCRALKRMYICTHRCA